jgi:ribosomal protein L15
MMFLKQRRKGSKRRGRRGGGRGGRGGRGRGGGNSSRQFQVDSMNSCSLRATFPNQRKKNPMILYNKIPVITAKLLNFSKCIL